MTIAQAIADNWPTTDAILTEKLSGYAEMKARAIDRAIRELYGAGNVPASENLIPAVAANWVADKATIFLIPAAKDYYAAHTRLSDSKESMTVRHHDRLAMLDQLKLELEGDCLKHKDAALDAIDALEAPERAPAVPAVSTTGLLLDPTIRSYERGPFSW